MPESRVNLSELAGGAVAERFNIELQKVLENIMDPNTDAKKARKLTLTLTFKADENRDVASVNIEAKTTLAPANSLATKILMDKDRNGHAVGAELFQTELFKGEDFVPETSSAKVSYLEQKQAGRV